MRPFLNKLKVFVEHPTTQFLTGLILFVSGATEVVYDFISAERQIGLGVHHGVALFGVIQMLGSLPELVDGLDRSFRAVEKSKDTDTK